MARVCARIQCNFNVRAPSQDALAGRVNPLPNVSPLATRNMLEGGIDQELQIQFLVGEQTLYHSPGCNQQVCSSSRSLSNWGQ